MQTITKAEARRLLPTSKHALDDELERQADVQDRISVAVAQAGMAATKAKDNLARVEASLLQDVHTNAANEGKKLTVDQAGGFVRRHRDRMRAFDELCRCQAEHEEWQGIYEAWRSKGFNLKALGALFEAQYFTINSAGKTQARHGVRDYESARESLAGRMSKRLSEEESAKLMHGATAPRERRRAS